MRVQTRKQLNLIQCSRAFVPLLVLLFHAEAFMKIYFNYDLLKLPDVPKSGGVYYFFALSGFMVYYIYYKEIGNPQKIKSYFYSRFTRIYPIYWILSLCVLPVYFIFPNFGQGNERYLNTIITSFLLIPNKNEPILSVAWSLVHTVYFYFMFAVVFNKNKMISILIIFLWAVLSFVNSISFITSNYYFNFFFSFNNLIFLSGIACAYVVLNIRIHYRLSLLLVAVGMIGFPLSWFNTQYSVIDLGLQATTSLSSILLILGLSSIDLRKDIKIPKFAKYLGDASFSIYLTHFLTMSLICKLLRLSSFTSFNKFAISIGIMILSLTWGCIVYSFLEYPLVQKIKYLNKKKRNQIINQELNLVKEAETY